MGEEVEQLKQTPDSGAPASLTPAQFLSWKRQKDANASAQRAEAARKREEDIRAGVVQMNGRELFVNEPWVFDNNLY
ncbi:zinc finger CCCH domain-containing protein 15 homolog [Chenopodium quinoa]|uniref:ZC3H15/TMA46 family C-terminal domain-containing protein n=1 Tax=Chenopodium quinoa TaxID=63459 RepID=A0A803M295_CHEQI|nr:zinc finger CCCH domain-containing protein 15 homolog [Chenopodium quinoa]